MSDDLLKALDMAFDDLVKDDQEYWITDGASRAYDLKEEIKSWGGFWVNDHKSWCILNPDEGLKSLFKSMGLRLQFRRKI